MPLRKTDLRGHLLKRREQQWAGPVEEKGWLAGCWMTLRDFDPGRVAVESVRPVADDLVVAIALDPGPADDDDPQNAVADHWGGLTGSLLGSLSWVVQSGADDAGDAHQPTVAQNGALQARGESDAVPTGWT